MKLRNKIFEIFQAQFPDLVEKIGNEVYIYLEEMILLKEIELDKTIDYKTPDFRDILHKIVDITGNALSLIGVPKDHIESDFKKEYRYFKTRIDLVTYKDWLYNEFNEYIDILLFSEILNYFVDPEKNIIKHMMKLGLIEDDIEIQFKRIDNKFPILKKYLSWQVKIKEKLLKIITNREQMDKLFQFRMPEQNIQSLYFLYVLAEFFEIEKHFNLRNAVPFLIEGIPKWSNELETNQYQSLIRPSTLFAGLYVVEKNDIDIDKTTCKKNLKDSLVEVVTLFQDPIFKTPYRVFYITKTMKLLNLKLTAQFLDNLVNINETSTTPDFLKILSTDKLGLINTLFKDLGFIPKLDTTTRNIMKDIIQNRISDGMFQIDEENKESSIESVWGGLSFMMENRSLDISCITTSINFLIDGINKKMTNPELLNPANLGNILLGIQILERLDNHYDAKIISALENYIFSDSKQYDKKIPTEMINNILNEAETPKYSITEMDSLGNINDLADDLPKFDSEFEFEAGLTDENTGDNFNISAEQSATDILESDSFLSEDVTPVDINSNSSKSQTQQMEDIPLTNSPEDIVDYFVNFPKIELNTMNSMQINYEAITNPTPIITDNLETLHKFVVIESVLRLKHRYSPEEIIQYTRSYWKKNGYGLGPAADVLSTYYVLSIYDIYKMIDSIDIYSVHDFLLTEIKYFQPYRTKENMYLFLSLKILNKYGLEMMSYDSLIDQIFDHEFLTTDEFDPLLDTLYVAMIVKILTSKQPKALDNLKIRFEEALKVKVGEANSVNEIISDTAKVMITIGLLGNFDALYENTIKFSQFIKRQGQFFSQDFKKEHISWGNDYNGLEIETNMLYWALLAQMCYKPVKNDELNRNICPDCGKYFESRPKFCNICGHKF